MPCVFFAPFCHHHHYPLFTYFLFFAPFLPSSTLPTFYILLIFCPLFAVINITHFLHTSYFLPPFCHHHHYPLFTYFLCFAPFWPSSSLPTFYILLMFCPLLAVIIITHFLHTSYVLPPFGRHHHYPLFTYFLCFAPFWPSSSLPTFYILLMFCPLLAVIIITHFLHTSNLLPPFLPSR